MLKSETIAKAVGWWAGKLITCKNSGLSAEERKNPDSFGYQMAERLMTVTKPKVTDEQINKFMATLTEALNAWPPACKWISLSVDYNPDKYLADALEAAGIENAMGVLPIKTRMHIENDKVEVAYGYGAEYVEV